MHSEHTDTGCGHRLSRAERARLLLTLPNHMPRWLLELLDEQPLLGAKLRLSPGLGGSIGGRRLVIHPAEMLIDEALLHAPGKHLIEQGLLPLAACGARGSDYYALVLQGADRGHLLLRSTHAGAFEPTGLSITDLLVHCTPDPALRTRKRLSLSLPPKRMRRASQKSPSRRDLAQKRLVARNLSLFAPASSPH